MASVSSRRRPLDLIFQEQAKGNDLAVGHPVRFGVGFGLPPMGFADVDYWLPAGKACFWGGWGGSVIIMDLDRKVTIAYDMNKMSQVGLGNKAARKYVTTIYEILGAEERAEQPVTL